MFVRWKRRKKAPTKPGRSPRRRSNAGDSLYCVLVESLRINGSPRQKVVCYLASVDENDCHKQWLRVDFWDYISTKLDKLPLTRRERMKIEESIGRVVTRVPEEEAVAFKKARKQYQEKRAQLIRSLELLRLLGS
jgi:hypothetical protein